MFDRMYRILAHMHKVLHICIARENEILPYIMPLMPLTSRHQLYMQTQFQFNRAARLRAKWICSSNRHIVQFFAGGLEQEVQWRVIACFQLACR